MNQFNYFFEPIAPECTNILNILYLIIDEHDEFRMNFYLRVLIEQAKYIQLHRLMTST